VAKTVVKEEVDEAMPGPSGKQNEEGETTWKAGAPGETGEEEAGDP